MRGLEPHDLEQIMTCTERGGAHQDGGAVRAALATQNVALRTWLLGLGGEGKGEGNGKGVAR